MVRAFTPPFFVSFPAPSQGEEEESSMRNLAGGGGYDGKSFRPALGKSWSYAASTRLHLSDLRASGGRAQDRVRDVVLLKHPNRPIPQVSTFVIGGRGVAEP